MNIDHSFITATNTGSKAAFELAKSWIRRCSKEDGSNHTLCYRDSEEWEAPTRKFDHKEERYDYRQFTHPFVDVANKDNALAARWFALDIKADIDSAQRTMDVVCMPLIEWSDPEGIYYVPYRHIAGLVLVEEQGNVFRRVGMFEDCWKPDNAGGHERWLLGGVEEIVVK
jgi:hypothetical protein